MLMDLADNLLASLRESTERVCRGLTEVGLVFSAGVDSTLVGVLASGFAEVRAYGVGFAGSQDLVHASDVEQLLPFKVDYVGISEESVEEHLPRIVAAVGEPNPLKVSVAVPFYFASMKAAGDGVGVMLCGQGADELFGGYNRYLKTVSDGGYTELSAELARDVEGVWDNQLHYDVSVAKSSGVELRFPYLDDEFKSAALETPAEEKIKTVAGEGEYECVDEVGGVRYIRKYVLRKMAEKVGVPNRVIKRPKKAAQYGSGSEKILKKTARKNGFTGRDGLREYLQSLY